MPPSVREYFLTVGETDDALDEDLFGFRPLAEVKPVHEFLMHPDITYPDRFSYPACYVFADYCLHCWEYAVKLTADSSQPAPVFRVTGSDKPGEQMAASFLEFMGLCAKNADFII